MIVGTPEQCKTDLEETPTKVLAAPTAQEAAAEKRCRSAHEAKTSKRARIEHEVDSPKRVRQISIVLTGGPCSGKSSVLATIRERLGKRGIQVITVPEYATHFFSNSDGFQLEWVATKKEEDLQNVLLRYQMVQEDLFQDYAELNSKTTVLLLDRGCLDQKVFVSSDAIWQSAMKRNNVDEQQLLARYDMVMHLATCALIGNYEWGPGSNNPGRYHSPDEAARLDGIFNDVYRNHKQFRSVPHCDKFAQKVDLVMKYLEDALGVDGLVGARERTRVSVDRIPEEVLREAQVFATSTTYIDEPMQLSVRRVLETTVAAWQEGLAGDGDPFEALTGAKNKAPFHQMFEERRSIPEESTLARRSIPEEMYHNSVLLAKHPSVQKHVLSFQDEAGSHHELFYFNSGDRTLILDHPAGQALPLWVLASTDEATIGKRRSASGVLKAHSTEEESQAHRSTGQALF